MMTNMRKFIDVLNGVVTEAKFGNVSCSQCGKSFGPGDSGYSHCEDHEGKKSVDESAVYEGDGMIDRIIARLQDFDALGYNEEAAYDAVTQELTAEGYTAEEISEFFDEVSAILDGRGEPNIDNEPDDGMSDMEADADALASAGFGTDEDYGYFGGDDMFEDFGNGYEDVHTADQDDYFPNGAEGPVVDKVGPAGANQGDNPEQKKMQVEEVHKELVYNYRSYLKESEIKKKS